MTAAAAPVMYGPDRMRLLRVAAPAAIIAALLAAASTNGNTSPVAKARAPGQPGNRPGWPGAMASPLPSLGPAGTGRRARDGAGLLLPPGGEFSWCHQFDGHGRRSATPRMAGCQHDVRQVSVVLVFPFPGLDPGVFLSSRIRSTHTWIASPSGTR